MQRFPALPGDREIGLAVCHAENGRIETVNRAFATLHGCTPEELAGRALHEVFNLECLACFAAQPGDGDECFMETTHVRSDGSTVDVLFSVSMLQDKEGAAGRSIVQMADRSLRADKTETFRDAEERLRETTTRFLSLIQTIPDLVWMKDKEGRYLFCNAPFESFFGVPEYEIVGKSDHDFIEKEAADFFIENDRAALEAGKALLREERIVFKEDGRHARIESRKVPVYRPDGGLMGVLGIGRPITENSAPQTQRQIPQSSFRSLADAFPYPLVHYGADGTHRWHNRAAREQLLDPMKQFQEDAPVAETPFAHSGEIFSDTFETVLETGETRTYELTLETPAGGAFREFLVHFLPESDGENISGVLLVAKDVTEQKNTETKLHEAEAMHALIFRQSQVAISVFALERWVYKEANQSFFEHTGYSREELIEKPGVALWVDEGEQDRYIEALQTTGKVEGFEFRYRRKDGTTAIAVSYGAILEIDGEWCILSENYDITEKKRLEEAAKEYERMLRSLTDNLPGFAFTYRLDKEGGEALLFATPGIREIYGLSAEDAVWDLSAFHAIMHESDLSAFQEALRETAVTLAPHTLLLRIRHPEKGVRWLESRMMPERAPGGSTLWHGVALDVTDRVRAEEETRDGRNLLHAVQESSSEVTIFALDTEYRYLTFNTAHQKFMKNRWDAELSVGDSFLDKVTDEIFRAFAKEGFDRVLSGETFSTVSEEALTIEKEAITEYWENYAAPIRNDAGEITGLSVVAVNITERVLADRVIRGLNASLERKVGERTAQLRDALAFSEGVVNAVPDLLLEVDREGTCLNAWASDETLPQAHRRRLPGKHIKDLLSREALETAFKTKEEVDAKGSSKGNTFKTELRGAELWFELSATKKEPEGTYLVVAHDVTKRKANEKKIRLLEKALEETDEMIYLFDGERALYVSGSAERILGYSRDELMEPGFMRNVDREYTPEESIADIELIKREKHLTATRIHTAKDGRKIPVELSRTLFETGGNTYLLAAARDITERLAAREALQKSEEKMRLFFERQIVGMAITSPKQKWIHINDRLCEMLGYTKEELVQKSWAELTHPDDLGLDADAFVKMAAGEIDNAILEKRLLHKEGHMVIANLSLACVRLPDGAVDYVLTVFEDITARKEAEKAVHELNISLRHKVEARTAQLQKALAFSEGIISAIPDLLFEVDKEGTYLGVWTQDEKLLVQQKEIVLGKNLRDVLPPDAAEAAFKSMEEAERDGRSIGKAYRLELSDGEHWFELHTAKKEPGGSYLAISRDITEHKRMEEALAAGEREFRSLSENTPDNIARWDPEGRYLYVNKTHERTLGVPAARIVGKAIGEIVPDHHTDVISAIARIAQGEEETLTVLQQLTAKNGETEYHEVKLIAEKNAGGKTVSILGIGRDMTEHKRLEAERNLLQERLLNLTNNIDGTVTTYRTYPDGTGEMLYANPGLYDVFGLTYEELAEDITPMADKMHPEDLQRMIPAMAESARTMTPYSGEFRVNHPEKGEIWVAQSTTPVYDSSSSILWHGLMFDITENKKKEEELLRLNCALKLLSQSNMALTQADDEAQLLEDICRLAVETGGYTMAWAGYAQEEAAGSIRPVAQAGFSLEALEKAVAGRSDEPQAGGMVGYAIKTGKRVINHNFENDPDMPALRDTAQEEGYRSGIALPLKNGTKVFGSLNIYSVRKNAFGKKEARLLEELAANLAYGIMMLRLRGEQVHMEALVRTREEAFRTLAENSPDTIARYDRECRRTYANATFAAIAGLEPEMLLGKKPTDYNPTEAALLYEEKIRAAFESGVSQELEYTWPDREGRPVTSHIRIVPEYDEALNIVSVLATGRDITRLKSYEAEIKRSESRLKEAQRIAKVGSWELEFPSERLSWSDEIYRIFGLDPAQDVPSYEAFLALIHPDDREKVDKAYTKSLEEKSPYEVEHRILMPNGRVKYVKERGETLYDEIGTPLRSAGTVQDITGQKLAERKIHIMAHHDALTNLPNRTLAQKRLEGAIEKAKQNGKGVALLFIDLDSFKTVNDSLGHTVGDEMLKKVAERLGGALGAAGTVSRQGGDEFLIILPEVRESDEAGEAAEMVLQNFEKPIHIGDHLLYASMSIGIAVSPYDGETFETLLQKADTAMYKAKESGKNTYMFYSEAMNRNMAEHLRMQHDLKNAIKNGELTLHFQPQIDLGGSRIIGAEALLRWHHPHNGPVSPDVFIPVAESCGLIVPIGEWVLTEACRQAAMWHEQGIRITVAVNISALQFKRDNLESIVRDAVAVSGIAPEYLELELTESVMMHDTEKVLQTVRNLKAIGVQLSIDDFGTGYSSLSYLKRFAVDKLKIDQSFVRDVLKDPEDEAIVRAIIQMAKSLGLKTIAEGVETEEVLARIKTFECDEVQGYHFARPMEAAAFERFYRGF